MPTTSVVPAKKKAIEQTTEWKFAVEYILSKGNAAQAARQIFNIGNKGGQAKYAVYTASAMGLRMLKKALVQQYLEQFIANSDASVYEALNQLAKEMKGAKDADVRRKSAVDLLRYHGKYEKEDKASEHRHIHLVIPPRPAE